MSGETCYWGVCFHALETNTSKFFGFEEFLASLALMVLAWTTADPRYQFRVRTSPLPLQHLTYWMIATVGTLALLTDLWRAEGWLVPTGHLLTPEQWQALLGLVFLATFLLWAWFAFIRPPVFGSANAERTTHAVYRAIVRGSASELAIVADELARSMQAIVSHATNRPRYRDESDTREEVPKVEELANSLLLLMADPRFCRSVVSSSLSTAYALYLSMGESKKYGISVETFSSNLMTAAIGNPDSFLFHETSGYETGLMGYHQPLSRAMFANYEMVETVGTLLDVFPSASGTWTALQWEAYCRVVLMTFKSYVTSAFWIHSFALYRAFGAVGCSMMDLYKLNGREDYFDEDLRRRLEAIVSFIKDATAVLADAPPPTGMQVRARGSNHETFFDRLATTAFEVIASASWVRSPRMTCWDVQHNMVWNKFFGWEAPKGEAAKLVQLKLRRLIYDEILNLGKHPGYRGARILGMCLNIMMLQRDPNTSDRSVRALQKAVLAWTQRNYGGLVDREPDVAAHCLFEGMSFDAASSSIRRAFPPRLGRREATYHQLAIDPPKNAPDRDASMNRRVCKRRRPQ